VEARPKLSREQALVMQILTSKARGKAHYATAGSKLAELKALCGADSAIAMPDGRKFAVVDTFAGAEYAKKMVIIDRFEVKEVKA
jgi:hypothetical protein